MGDNQGEFSPVDASSRAIAENGKSGISSNYDSPVNNIGTDNSANNSAAHTSEQASYTDALSNTNSTIKGSEIPDFKQEQYHSQSYPKKLTEGLVSEKSSDSLNSDNLPSKHQPIDETKHELTSSTDHEEADSTMTSAPPIIEPSSLTWDDENDKCNPLNWPSWRKWFCTMTVASLCLVVSLGSSLYVAGIPELVVSMGVSQEASLVGLTLYLIGLAWGPVAAAPLSELYGRKYIYVISLPVSMLFTMGVGLSQNLGSVLVLRFFSGLFASPAMAVAGGTVTDVFAPEEMGTGMGLFCLAAFLGPVLGPVIGGFVAVRENWRWTMWVLLMASGLVLPFVLLLPETYKPVILKERAAKRGVIFRKNKINFAFVKKVLTITLIRPIEMLFVEPIVMVFSIYIAFVFAVLFGFFEAFPIIFRGVYGMELDISGLPFISVGIGLISGVMFYLYFDHYVFFKKNPDGTRGKRDENNDLVWDPPETKLIICKVGAICLPISLFWLAWTARPGVHWMAPTASAVPFGFGLILIFFATIQYFSLSYPPLSVASALAANNLLRYLVASVFPLFTVQMYRRLGIDWATSLFAFVSLAMVPVPWIFEKYGPQLRSKSTFGYAALIKQKQAAAAAAAAASNSANIETPSTQIQSV